MTDKKIEAAARCYINRQSRIEHPEGEFDNAQRWYPSDEEEQECCAGIRSPSRSWPYSYMQHCRTMTHVAHLHGVEERELRRQVRAIRKAEKVQDAA